MEKAYRQFFVELSNGTIIEIDELDFNNIRGRIGKGSTMGWYVQRGESMGKQKDWMFQFKYLTNIWASHDPRVDKPIRNLDVNKRKMPEVGKLPEEPKDCDHDWNNENDWQYVTQIVGGVNRYYKQCNKCNAKSTLIKKREVELAMEQREMSLNDVPLVQ